MIFLVETFGKKHLSRGSRPETRMALTHFSADFNLETGFFEFFHNKAFKELQNCMAAECTYYDRPMSTFKKPTTDELRDLVRQIDCALAIGSVLVHCEHGEDRTGMVIAAWRIIKNGWSVQQAKKEMYDFGFNYWFYFSWTKVIDQLYAEQMDVK